MGKKDKKAKKEELEQEILNKEEKNTKQNEENTTETANTESSENVGNENDFEAKFNEMNDKYLRLSAEFDNYRKRTLKERMELIKSAGSDILINFLPIVDNLERAKQSAETSEDIEAVKNGIDLIFKNLTDFLSQKGIKEIEAIGKELDTDFHEAITKIPAPSKKLKGKIVDVIEKGYMLNDKVIRFAKVVIGE